LKRILFHYSNTALCTASHVKAKWRRRTNFSRPY